MKQNSDWTSGYVADIGYTYGYYSELNPNRATLAFLNAGYVPPTLGVHCELGFGQGLSVNIHAAASGSTWFATDFNPSQAAFAKSLAFDSGADAHLSDESFAHFCNRSDIPEFDSIGLHGIWSWISDENRTVITEFIQKKLKVGGALYISYNTLPGWANFAPMRHLMTEHAASMSAAGAGRVKQVTEALSFVEKLVKTNPLYIRANPQVPDRFEKVKAQDPHYLAHEYFNRDWQPMYFSSMANWLRGAKVEFVCSAHYLDHVDSINLTSEQQALINSVIDPIFKETVRDFVVNQQFRRDYWVKGPRKLNRTEQAELLRLQKVILTTSKVDVALKVSGSLGEATMSDAIYSPILDFLSDHQPRTVGAIELKVKDKGVKFENLIQALVVLTGAGHLASVQDEEKISKSNINAKKLNDWILKRATSSGDLNYLASPVTGGGYSVNRFQQLFLLSVKSGRATTQQMSEDVWNLVSSQGQKLVKEGKTLESKEENLAELAKQATEFLEKKLPIIKALKLL